MPKRAKQDPVAELADKMIAVLRAQRLLGGDSYPLTVRRLAELTDPAAPPEQVLKAVAKKKLFGEHALVIQPKDLNSPVALAEDADQLAHSPAVLRFVLESVCTPDKPTCGVDKLKGKVPRKLQPAFAAALDQRLEDHDLPSGVAVVPVKSKQHFHLERYPLPKPPARVLAEDLVRVLEARRRLGGDAYPLTFSGLVELAGPGVDNSLLPKALAEPLFRGAVLYPVLAAKYKPESPVALAADRDGLLESDLLFETVVRLARKGDDQVCTLAMLKKPVAKAWQKPVEEVLKRRVADRRLPSTVGCLVQKKKPVLFLLSDVVTGPATGVTPGERREPARPAAPPPRTHAEGPAPHDFGGLFEEAFQRLDRQRGSHNFVSLLELRRAVPVERPLFDTELRKLRLAGRYTLSAAEGRHGISAEEREAGILEDGALLLYVSRKLS